MKNTLIPAELQPKNDPLAPLIDALATRIIERLGATSAPDKWLFLSDLEAEGWSRESLAAASTQGLAVCRGPKAKIMVRRSEVDRWIASRPWKPTRKAQAPADDLEEWQSRADAELEALAKGGAA